MSKTTKQSETFYGKITEDGKFEKFTPLETTYHLERKLKKMNEELTNGINCSRCK